MKPSTISVPPRSSWMPSASAPASTTSRELGLPVRAVNVGEAAPTRENCMRLRDELWYKGREWFQERECSIPNDEDLITELTTPTYTFTLTGKIVVERKQT